MYARPPPSAHLLQGIQAAVENELIRTMAAARGLALAQRGTEVLKIVLVPSKSAAAADPTTTVTYKERSTSTKSKTVTTTAVRTPACPSYPLLPGSRSPPGSSCRASDAQVQVRRRVRLLSPARFPSPLSIPRIAKDAKELADDLDDDQLLSLASLIENIEHNNAMAKVALHALEAAIDERDPAKWTI